MSLLLLPLWLLPSTSLGPKDHQSHEASASMLSYLSGAHAYHLSDVHTRQLTSSTVRMLTRLWEA